MKELNTFQEFLATQGGQIPILWFMFNLVAAAILGFLLGLVYIRYGTSLSNRKLFSQNFILLAMTTMLIISIVKSSLALSLGLVGALSIVRFRAAIKEPEEISYLFLTIAIGLGFGANQGLITLAGFLIIVFAIWVRNVSHRSDENQNLYLSVASQAPGKVPLDSITAVLNKNCSTVNLKRYDETKEVIEASFLVEFDNIEQLYISRSELQNLSDNLKITFLDNKGLAG